MWLNKSMLLDYGYKNLMGKYLLALFIAPEIINT